MSGYRNKLLIKLSQRNVQHYNNSNSATMVSELNANFQKENYTYITDASSLCVPDDPIDLSIDFRDISPTLLPLSESESLTVITSSITQDYVQTSESVDNNLHKCIELFGRINCVQISAKALL